MAIPKNIKVPYLDLRPGTAKAHDAINREMTKNKVNSAWDAYRKQHPIPTQKGTPIRGDKVLRMPPNYRGGQTPLAALLGLAIYGMTKGEGESKTPFQKTGAKIAGLLRPDPGEQSLKDNLLEALQQGLEGSMFDLGKEPTREVEPKMMWLQKMLRRQMGEIPEIEGSTPLTPEDERLYEQGKKQREGMGFLDRLEEMMKLPRGVR